MHVKPSKFARKDLLLDTTTTIIIIIIIIVKVKVVHLMLEMTSTSTTTTSTKKMKIITLITMMAMQIMMIIVVMTQSLGITGNICSSIKKNGTTTHQRMEDILEVRIVSTYLLIVILFKQ